MIRAEIELLGRPHRPRSAETGQDFICDEKSVEFICDFSHGVNKIVGRDDVARRALHRLQDDRCNLALGVVFMTLRRCSAQASPHDGY